MLDPRFPRGRPAFRRSTSRRRGHGRPSMAPGRGQGRPAQRLPSAALPSSRQATAGSTSNRNRTPSQAARRSACSGSIGSALWVSRSTRASGRTSRTAISRSASCSASPGRSSASCVMRATSTANAPAATRPSSVRTWTRAATRTSSATATSTSSSAAGHGPGPSRLGSSTSSSTSCRGISRPTTAPGRRSRIDDEVVPVFHDLFGQVIRQLDPEVIATHQVRPLKSIWADILAHACRPDDWHSPVVARTKLDSRAGLQRLCLRFVGASPQMTFRVDGADVLPASREGDDARLLRSDADVRADRVGPDRGFDRGPDRRRDDADRGRLAGASPRSRPGPPEGKSPPRSAAGSAASSSAVRRSWRDDGRTAPGSAMPGSSSTACTRPTTTPSDCSSTCGPSGRTSTPGSSSRRDSPDWRRMRAAGVERLVPFGTFTWKMLMLNASWVLSSHADVAITRPTRVMRRLQRPTWRYGFLQHGVTKDDLSKWLNQKDMDLFVVSTADELASVTSRRHGLRRHHEGDAQHRAATIRQAAGQGTPPSARPARPDRRRADVAAVADRVLRPAMRSGTTSSRASGRRTTCGNGTPCSGRIDDRRRGG